MFFGWLVVGCFVVVVVFWVCFCVVVFTGLVSNCALLDPEGRIHLLFSYCRHYEMDYEHVTTKTMTVI